MVSTNELDVVEGTVARGCCFGKTKSGKSHWANQFVADWPGRVLVIDVTGDVAPELRRLGVPYHHTHKVPRHWPHNDETDGPWRVVVFKPDSASASFVSDVDEAFALAWRTGKVVVFVDEVHTCFPMEWRTKQPSARRVLIEGRHRDVGYWVCGPRPVLIDRMWITQSDHTLMFRLPHEDDRETVCKALGFDVDEIDDMHAALDQHGYIWLNNVTETATKYPPLPARQRRPIPHHE